MAAFAASLPSGEKAICILNSCSCANDRRQRICATLFSQTISKHIIILSCIWAFPQDTLYSVYKSHSHLHITKLLAYLAYSMWKQANLSIGFRLFLAFFWDSLSCYLAVVPDQIRSSGLHKAGSMRYTSGVVCFSKLSVQADSVEVNRCSLSEVGDSPRKRGCIGIKFPDRVLILDRPTG